MPKATSIAECRRLAGAVTALGGVVPAPLANLCLRAYDLLASPGPSEPPEKVILTAALDGTLDAKTLAKLLPGAATEQQIARYRAELARSSEHTLVGEFHRQVDSGGADQILRSLRGKFTENAKAIAHARTLINPESSIEHIMATAQPDMITAWQGLNGHLAVVERIGAIASQFGCRPIATFPQIAEYANADGFEVSDRALMCCEGDLVAASAVFGRPDRGHRDSPWARTVLKLHTIGEARERYREWACAQWENQHSGPRTQWFDEARQPHDVPLPPNPYAKAAT